MTTNAILSQLASAASQLNSIQDLDSALEKALTLARQFTKAEAGNLYMLENNNIIICYSQNNAWQKTYKTGEKPSLSEPYNPLYTPQPGKPANSRILARLRAAADEQDPSSGLSLTMPLIDAANGELLGLLKLFNTKDNHGNIRTFDQNDDITLSFFAPNVVQVIKRAQETRRLLLRMIAMAEMRDPSETALHVNRVGEIAKELYEHWAIKHKIDKEDIEKNKDKLRIAAMLHDVGKVAITDKILRKPAKFTENEYDEMKSHTWLGAKIFAEAKTPFEVMARDVILNHHENWDGSGYPGFTDYEGNLLPGMPNRGKKHDEISIYAQIVAIADVFDALLSPRVYKDSWNKEKALKEIKRQAGFKFNPELIDIFFENLSSIENLLICYPVTDPNKDNIF